MHRYVSRVPLRSISDSLYLSKSSVYDQKNLVRKLESLRTFTTSRDHDCFGYGRKSITRLLQVQIVDALRSNERSRASSLLSELGRGNYSLRADDFIYILEHCSKSPDPLFVMEIWRIMDEKEVHVNNRCYMLSIQALCKGGYLEEAFNLLNFVGENHDIHPILPMYNNFLRGCVQTRSLLHANQCLDLMEHQVLGKNEVTYSQFLKLAVLQQNLSAAHKIWKEYMTYYSMSIISLRKFIWSFTRLRDLESAYAALQHMVDLVFKGSIFINKSAEGRLCSSRLDIPIPKNGDMGLKRCMEENEHSLPSVSDNSKKIDSHASNVEDSTIFYMGSKEDKGFGINMLEKYKGMPVMKVLRWSFSDVIYACAQTQNCGLAEQLILQMQNLGLEPSCHTYDGLIKAIVSDRGFSDGMEVLKTMQLRNLKPYDSTLAALSIGSSKALQLDLAESLLDQISRISYVHPFNAFLAACDTLDQPERAVPILSKMKQLKLQPNVGTYELLFSLFGNVNAPYEEGNMLSQVDVARRIKAIEMDMMNNGIQHSHLSMKNLLKALGAEGMIRELMQYLHVAENQFFRTNTYLGTPIYNTVLHSLVEAKESHIAIEIFKNMISRSLPRDAATYNIMIDCCSTIKCYKSACALVSMMMRDGFLPWTLTYTALIKILLEHEDFDEALNLLDQARLEEIPPALDGLQGHREWLAEIIFLGQLRHPHLVKLIGYCCEDEHRLLIYEYMARGSLENQLFRRYSAALPWSTRMKILFGAAKGLAFLHEGDKPVIYRDFKASNILLDPDYTAKLSDFGLAKDGPEGDETHVSTRIMGTHGYAAPEYIMTGHLTTMSDVYSFGVVLLEVISGKRSMDKTRPSREQNLVEWARPMLKDPRKLDRVIDSRLEGLFSTKGAQKAAELAYKCLSHQAKARPAMSDVVKILEPLQDFDDTVISPFVYVVPAEGEVGDESESEKDISHQEIKERDDGQQNRPAWRHRIKLPLSLVAYSESALYKKFRHELNTQTYQ